MSAIAERVAALVTPLLADLGLELYDCEHHGGTLKIIVDRPGGIDLEALSLATRVVSRELDHADPMPGQYTLEVTSPGLERPLRTPAHFQRAVGTTVSVRTLPGVEPRRAQGILRDADDDGITVFVADGAEAGEQRFAYADLERARTVFEWGPTPKPGGAKKPGGSTRPPTKKQTSGTRVPRGEAGAS